MTPKQILDALQAETGLLVGLPSNPEEQKRREVLFSGEGCRRLQAGGHGRFMQIAYHGDQSWGGRSTDKIVRTSDAMPFDVIAGAGTASPRPSFLEEPRYQPIPESEWVEPIGLDPAPPPEPGPPPPSPGDPALDARLRALEAQVFALRAHLRLTP